MKLKKSDMDNKRLSHLVDSSREQQTKLIHEVAILLFVFVVSVKSFTIKIPLNLLCVLLSCYELDVSYVCVCVCVMLAWSARRAVR